MVIIFIFILMGQFIFKYIFTFGACYIFHLFAILPSNRKTSKYRKFPEKIFVYICRAVLNIRLYLFAIFYFSYLHPFSIFTFDHKLSDKSRGTHNFIICRFMFEGNVYSRDMSMQHSDIEYGGILLTALFLAVAMIDYWVFNAISLLLMIVYLHTHGMNLDTCVTAVDNKMPAQNSLCYFLKLLRRLLQSSKWIVADAVSYITVFESEIFQ